MINAVITSKDPWLLARMATDLQLHTGRDIYPDSIDPFKGNSFLHTLDSASSMFSYNGRRYVKHEFFTLTASNYIDTLTKILAV